jgi:hypothetical protein
MHNQRLPRLVPHSYVWGQQPAWSVWYLLWSHSQTTDSQAQDLGLHRESTLRAQTAQDLAYVELRRRVWAACVIFDRWYGAALGIPLLVDLLDCDVLLPAPYDIIPDAEPTTWPIEPAYMALSEHLKLSILIGRVLKAIYSPTGLKHATDGQLESLKTDMDGWLAALPDELRYKGTKSSHSAGESESINLTSPH